MRKNRIQLNIILFLATILLSACNHSMHEAKHDVQTQQDKCWKIGAKIHFEEESGNDYIGLKEINAFTKDALKSVLSITKESCENNAKILLKKDKGGIAIDHYTEKSRPNIGEEMHATLLYTSSRGFCDSETLKQICPVLFKDCHSPIAIEDVNTKYQAIVNPDWKFKIEEIKVYENKKSITFSAILSFEDHKNIYFKDKPISAGLHLTLIQCFEPSIFNKQTIQKCLDTLNHNLKGKFIKIAAKNGVADLEFGMSGQPWRIRSGQKIEFKK